MDYTFGGKYNGGANRADISAYDNSPLAGIISSEARRVNARMWNHVNTRSNNCLEVSFCAADNDCPNYGAPICLERVCNVTDGLCEDSTNSLPNCCGNGVCDLGELRDECPNDNCPACYDNNDCNTVCALETCNAGECEANPSPSEL